MALLLEVEDDEKEFAPGKTSKELRHRSMRHRADLLGAELEVE